MHVQTTATTFCKGERGYSECGKSAVKKRKNKGGGNQKSTQYQSILRMVYHTINRILKYHYTRSTCIRRTNYQSYDFNYCSITCKNFRHHATNPDQWSKWFRVSYITLYMIRSSSHQSSTCSVPDRNIVLYRVLINYAVSRRLRAAGLHRPRHSLCRFRALQEHDTTRYVNRPNTSYELELVYLPSPQADILGNYLCKYSIIELIVPNTRYIIICPGMVRFVLCCFVL